MLESAGGLVGLVRRFYWHGVSLRRNFKKCVGQSSSRHPLFSMRVRFLGSLGVLSKHGLWKLFQGILTIRWLNNGVPMSIPTAQHCHVDFRGHDGRTWQIGSTAPSVGIPRAAISDVYSAAGSF